jgi:hypothetical protein
MLLLVLLLFEYDSSKSDFSSSEIVWDNIIEGCLLRTLLVLLLFEVVDVILLSKVFFLRNVFDFNNVLLL